VNEVSGRIFELIEQVLNEFSGLVAGKFGSCSARHLSKVSANDSLFNRWQQERSGEYQRSKLQSFLVRKLMQPCALSRRLGQDDIYWKVLMKAL
jgi:hypothetical protein